MFENKIIWGGIYKAKDLKSVWMHAANPKLDHNDQRYNIWIPVNFSGNSIVKPGIYMIDTYQAPRCGSSFQSCVEALKKFKTDGDAAYYSCGNYYYNSRVRLTDSIFEEFELIADLNEYKEINIEETYKYTEKDVLRYIKLYHEHKYPNGICLVKKDASINCWNYVEDLCDNIVDNISTPYVSTTSKIAYEDLINYIKSIPDKDLYNSDRVKSVIELYDFIKSFEIQYHEKFEQIKNHLGSIRYEWKDEV